MDELEITGARLCDRVEDNERRHMELAEAVKKDRDRLNHNLERYTNQIRDLTAMIGEYRVELIHVANAKPSWAVSYTITALVGALSALAVYLLTH